MKLWAGRFAKETDSRANSFNTSLPFDRRMFAQDIEASAAHAEMLAATGVISSDDAKKILSGLEGILRDITEGKLTLDNDAEDIHMFIEAELTARIGDAGKRLHTARSRNDQVAADLRLYLRDETDSLKALIKELCGTLISKADEHKETIMPGYTHLQRAQPVTFGHHLMAYVSMFLRDIERLDECRGRINVMPLGSCALAGTTYPIDRRLTGERLKFGSVCANSLDGVSDRDFCIELAACVSIAMMHLSRLSEEIILWSSWEFKFVELDDAFSTGSSIMPQKKNADIAELVRGKTGRVYGDLMALLTVMKGLPLAYNKDMQEDKEAVFDAVDTLRDCLTAFIPMLETMTVLCENMRNAAARGFINATDLADYLVKKGVAFRDAYKVCGELVALCVRNGIILEEIPIETLKEHCGAFEKDVYGAISLESCVNARNSEGGTSPLSVARQIQLAKNALEETK